MRTDARTDKDEACLLFEDSWVQVLTWNFARAGMMLREETTVSQVISFTIRTSRMGSWYEQRPCLANRLIHHPGKLDGVSCDLCTTTRGWRRGRTRRLI